MRMKQQRNSKRRRDGVAGGVLLALFLCGVAGAQQVPTSDDAVGAPEDVVDESVPSPAQMLEQSRQALQRMARGAEHMQRQLHGAQEARDVVKSLCLDDKVSQLAVAHASAVDRVGGLESAAGSNDGDRMRHEFAVVLALLERAQALMTEADQCIGEEAGALGDARLVVTIDPNIARMDPRLPTDDLLSVPPVLTSPTR